MVRKFNRNIRMSWANSCDGDHLADSGDSDGIYIGPGGGGGWESKEPEKTFEVDAVSYSVCFHLAAANASALPVLPAFSKASIAPP